MDIILELTDTYIADHAYAYLFPIGLNLDECDADNATTTISSWEWQPATKLFHVKPSDAAYLSTLDRDNIYRQSITLFFVTW